MLDKRRNVFLALAQRRHGQVDDVQPIEQILAERALGDHVAQVAVGRGNDAHVDAAHGAIGTDLLQFAGFHEPQQQALHPERHLADFVEEDAAAVGHLELALLVTIGAGEAALHVAEEFGLQQGLGQAGAVDGDHGARGTSTALMDRVRDELLADAALARDEHLRIGSGNALDLLRQFSDRGAAANQLSVALASHAYLCSSCGPLFAVRYSLAFLRNASRLRRLFSSMPTNTAPSAGFDSRLERSTMRCT